MESGEKVVRISVRNLVEFILKEGDIDNRITAGTAEKDAMLMGSRLHRKIQKSMGLGYQAEVSLKISVPCQGFTLRVEGRADVIIVDTEQEYTIDKNKFVSKGHNTPFDGWKVKGKVLYTICDGKIIFENQEEK